MIKYKMNRAEVSSPTPSCMKGVTIVHFRKRNFRVTTASLPAGLTSHKDIYGKFLILIELSNSLIIILSLSLVHSNNKENENPVAESTKDHNITIKLNVPRTLYGLLIGKF